MASLVEYQELKHQIFADPNDLQVFEELLGVIELPTPPLSPDHADAADSSQLTDTTPEDMDVGETILQQMIEDMPFDSQSSYGSDSSNVLDINLNAPPASNPQALLQDCMWNCDAYEPRHSIGCNGMYTPAPSPPPDGKAATEEEEEEEDEDEEQVFEGSECTTAADEDISPTEVMVLVTAEGEGVVVEGKEGTVTKATESREPRKPVLCYRKSLSTGTTRLHPQATRPQAMSSESGKSMLFEGQFDPPQYIAKWC